MATAAIPSDVSLVSGVRVRLSPGAAGTVFSDHLVLKDGAAHVAHFGGYTVNVEQFEIQAADPGAEAVLRLTEKTIEVASLGGSLSVSDGGAMLTNVIAGTRVSFQQSGASSAGAINGYAHKRLPSDQRTMIWLIGISSAAALAIGLTAAAQGKSPF